MTDSEMPAAKSPPIETSQIAKGAVNAATAAGITSSRRSANMQRVSGILTSASTIPARKIG
jgi:hypothetical protein